MPVETPVRRRRRVRHRPRLIPCLLALVAVLLVIIGTYLLFTSGSIAVLKLLKSAAANAENNHQMDPEKLYVSQVFACPGPIIKRMMPRAQGRAYRINKRTSHITIAVAER